MARSVYGFVYLGKAQKKRPGVHAKSRNTNNKEGKYYSGSTYKGQGR
tara:strand:- start:448 stop:588 length:141 start_codon:yes stop_codon:yes gene_type:complete